LQNIELAEVSQELFGTTQQPKAGTRAEARSSSSRRVHWSKEATNGRSVLPWMIATTCRIADGRGGPSMRSSLRSISSKRRRIRERLSAGEVITSPHRSNEAPAATSSQGLSWQSGIELGLFTLRRVAWSDAKPRTVSSHQSRPGDGAYLCKGTRITSRPRQNIASRNERYANAQATSSGMSSASIFRRRPLKLSAITGARRSGELPMARGSAPRRR
jgi:hypothetical protein